MDGDTSDLGNKNQESEKKEYLQKQSMLGMLVLIMICTIYVLCERTGLVNDEDFGQIGLFIFSSFFLIVCLRNYRYKTTQLKILSTLAVLSMIGVSFYWFLNYNIIESDISVRFFCLGLWVALGRLGLSVNKFQS